MKVKRTVSEQEFVNILARAFVKIGIMPEGAKLVIEQGTAQVKGEALDE